MALAIGVALAVAIALPHRLTLERAAPGVAAAIWLSALVLRAAAVVACALALVVVVPSTELFTIVTHWCVHSVVPFVTAHLPLNGHSVGDTAVLLPAFAVAASAIWVIVGLARAARAVQSLLRRAVVGAGPRESLIIADGDVVVAAAGLRRPRVVISAGALAAFDDDELEASLEHEHGHIARNHRWLLVTAEVCRALGRYLPGTARAAQELLFHIERDADRYAVERTSNPTALASAICKTAQASRMRAHFATLGGGCVARRVRQLIANQQPPPSGRGLRAVAVAMVATAVVAVAALPAAAAAALVDRPEAAVLSHDCER